VQLRTRQDQWENYLTGDGVEVGPWSIRFSYLGLQASTLSVRLGRSRVGGLAVRLAGLSGINDVASLRRRRIGPQSAHGALTPDKSAVDTA
jgi:hypothetical protein